MSKISLRILTALLAFALLFAFAPPARAAAPDKSAVKQAYERYKASHRDYIDAVTRDLDEKTKQALLEKLQADYDYYHSLADKLNPLNKPVDTLEIGVASPDYDAKAAKLSAKERAARERSLDQVRGLRGRINGYIAGYEKSKNDALAEYKKTSWLSPVSKVKSLVSYYKRRSAYNKIGERVGSYEKPADQPYITFLKDMWQETLYVTGISAVTSDTNFDGETMTYDDPEAKDELVVYTIPAPHGSDWTTPRSLLFGGAFNQVTFMHRKHVHLIGHAFVKLKTSFDGQEVMAGMTTVNNTEEKDLVIKHAYCMGVLFADLMGKFDDPSGLKTQVEERYATGLVTYVRFLLTPETGKRLKQYYNEYVRKECFKHYGGANRPRYGEGGGCSPFAMSFVEVGGLMKPEFEKNWMLTLRIPLELVGGPRFKRVAMTRILGANRWAEENEPHAVSVMWDPTLMYRWINNRWKEEFRNPTGEYMLEKRKKTLGLVVDCRGMETPDEPIWLSGPNPVRQHGLRFGPDPYKATVNE